MQFIEPESQTGVCPVCGEKMVIRTTRGAEKTCGRRACKSMRNYSKRYRGSNSGPLDRPENINEKIKLP